MPLYTLTAERMVYPGHTGPIEVACVQVEADSEAEARQKVSRWSDFARRDPLHTITCELATEDLRRPIATNAPDLAQALFPGHPTAAPQ